LKCPGNWFIHTEPSKMQSLKRIKGARYPQKKREQGIGSFLSAPTDCWPDPIESRWTVIPIAHDSFPFI
jgi:hypothetical protein